ncbi:MAG TPA: LacI family DNA-binding transcriptional regulator [Patescibacteria group bacterium]|nr:LacI family DNA-binding transcriptional regulator [Patescibacteria group bacterium]
MATTIADVAHRAGCSTATVSRVLSGVGGARPATRDRVEAAARELGFRPSDVARSLKRQSTLTLGLIVTDIENPYFPQLVKGVEEAAIGEGYAILLCSADDDPDREASYLDILVERRVDGIIVAASTIGLSQAAWLARPPVPVVLVNTSVRSGELPSVASDNRAGGRLATRHLLGLGHRRFGYLMPPARNLDAPERLAGVRDELDAAGLASDGPDAALAVSDGAPTVVGGEIAMAALLARSPRPTAIVAYNDLMAIGAMRAIRRHGLRVPQDVSLVGFDDVALAAYVEPALTTLRQETGEMGRWAVATLTEQLAGRRAGGGSRRPGGSGGAPGGAAGSGSGSGTGTPGAAGSGSGTRTSGAAGSGSGASSSVAERRVVPVHLEVRESTGPPPD